MAAKDAKNAKKKNKTKKAELGGKSDAAPQAGTIATNTSMIQHSAAGRVHRPAASPSPLKLFLGVLGVLGG